MPIKHFNEGSWNFWKILESRNILDMYFRDRRVEGSGAYNNNYKLVHCDITCANKTQKLIKKQGKNQVSIEEKKYSRKTMFL